MSDLKTILHEVRVDWENVLSDDFNPLHYALNIHKNAALAGEFRDMYHKLDTAMEKIIEINFKGFSDSVLSYNQFNRENRAALTCLTDILKMSSAIVHEPLEIKQISHEQKQSFFYNAKYEICKNLCKIKEAMVRFDAETELLKKCHLIVKCLDIIDDENYIKIKAVEEYRKQVYEKYMDIVGAVNAHLCEFIFKNKMENVAHFKCLFVLGSLHELEQHLARYFKRAVFAEIENLILKSYQNSSIEIDALCKAVGRKFESIKNNMQILIEKVSLNFELNKEALNFFGSKTTTFPFCTEPEHFLKILTKELDDFILSYSRQEDLSSSTFDLSFVVDSLDYSKIYGPKYAITARLSKKADALYGAHEGYTVIMGPQIGVSKRICGYIRDIMLKNHLMAKEEARYGEYSAENSQLKIERIFSGDVFVLDHKGKKLKIYDEVKNILKECNSPVLKELVAKRMSVVMRRKHNELFTNSFEEEECSEESDKKQDSNDKSFEENDNEKDSKDNNDSKDKNNSDDGNKNNSDGNDSNSKDNKSEVSRNERKEKTKKNKDDNKKNSDKIKGVHKSKLREMLVNKLISKKDLFLSRAKYQQAIYIANTLRELNALLDRGEIEDLCDKYLKSIITQIHIDFFYFFDLMYRQKNYHLYTKNIVKILKIVYSEAESALYFDGLLESVDYYVISNISALSVNSQNELDKFVKNLKMLDEILGGVEIEGSFAAAYKFIGDTSSKKDSVLYRKIN
ncbi:hypothetical protein ENBRE01_0390 [Enteropsectra breve]|nr:hypothetical protein ENBRE01_0390 [Enteropsectra breve]